MSPSRTSDALRSLEALPDDALQAYLLEGVSRTFALTIPQLPRELAAPVANAYLLCRIVDTIEDEVALSPAQKRKYCQQFVAAVEAKTKSHELRDELAPLLSDQTSPQEHELVRLIPRVLTITHSFDSEQRDALATCVRIMGQGMADFQGRDLRHGLATMADMDSYCYYVAGVVGEMLTRLFCHYSPDIAARRKEMLRLAVSFGQGLQMTNILKDIWDDQARNVCWLPREVFDAVGFDLSRLAPGHDDPRFAEGMTQLVGVAHGHLANALAYTLLIPERETGIREFCLWALGMAVLTLRKVNARPNFSTSSQVKISRWSVKLTILTSRLLRSSNGLLRGAFRLAATGLPGGTPPAGPLAS